MSKAPCVVPAEQKLKSDLEFKIRFPIASMARIGCYWWVSLYYGATAGAEPKWYKVSDLLRAIPSEDL